jgi:hypothetical protein
MNVEKRARRLGFGARLMSAASSKIHGRV